MVFMNTSYCYTCAYNKDTDGRLHPHTTYEATNAKDATGASAVQSVMIDKFY